MEGIEECPSEIRNKKHSIKVETMEQSPQMYATSSGEPQWANKISNSLICNYFYIFFVIFAVWAALALFGGLMIFASRSKMTFGMLIAVIINVLLSFGISATTALFLYLICDRALKPAMGFADYEGFKNCDKGSRDRDKDCGK